MFHEYPTTSPTGTFRTGPQRAGDYLVVAVGPSGPLPEFGNRGQLDTLVRAGERITLVENEERMLDLAVLKIDR